jgi:FtsP/CotA-like multicopper oxidase with cupredoxin domain
VNGKGVYNWSATQVTIKTHGLTAHGQLCPGQMDPPKCQWCYEPGVGTKQCDNSSADLLCGDAEVFEVEAGKTSRIRLISDAQLYMLQVCIDHHNFTVLATDMMPIEPFQTKCMIIAPGERYDIAVFADQQPGDYMIRFITLEHGAYLESLPFIENCKLQAKGPCSLTATPEHTWGVPAPGFPHQGFAILRYKGATPSMPMPPDAPDYWLSAVTLGCSSDPTRKDPRRCHHIRELKSIPETLSSYYPQAARGTDFKQPSELKPTVQFTTQISFLPDEVPRIENKALLSRMQVYDNATYGFPYTWSNNASDWHEDTPVAFVFPKEPTLSLEDDERNAVYNYRKVWREPNRSNAGEWYPNFPKGWSRISSGTQTVSVKYGDVVRIFMNATIPFGAGPAMPHPMHFHGHKVAILGIGRWNEPFDESKLNTTHPVYKDVVPLYTDSWMVLQFVAGNPGVWPFHCHVNIHFNSGMGIAIDSGAELSDFRKTPNSANNCPRSR